MKRATVKLTLYKTKINSILSKVATALADTAHEVIKITEQSQVIPYDTGATQDSAHVVFNSKLGHASIAHNTPYMNKIYWNPSINFHRDKNVNAKALWYDNWFNSDRQRLKAIYISKLRVRLRGYLK